MKIDNPDLIQLFQTPGRCELCNGLCTRRTGHHLWHQTPAIDIRINLFFTGAFGELACNCHDAIHMGGIHRDEVLRLVARRERTTPEIITEIMHLFRRVIKPSKWQLIAALEELSPPAKALAIKELVEAGKLDTEDLAA